jgi:chorismate synthase
MGNTIGSLFTVTSFGESHGTCVGVVVDGCPPGLPLTSADAQKDIDRRRPVAGAGSTTRAEEDKVDIISGVFDGRTTGAPLCMLIWNKDAQSGEYEKVRSVPRPGHADYTAFVKYGGFNDYRGAGRFSGRITATFVMAGSVARKLLGTVGIDIVGHTIDIAGIRAQAKPFDDIRQNVDLNPLKCADLEAAVVMGEAIEQARQEGDSVGGVIEGIALGVPPGLGEPVFGTLEGELARALFAIPAVKGVEFGSGFAGSLKRGSENNDPFVVTGGKIATSTNNAGGVLGGISDGMPIVLRAAIKPTPSIARTQQSVDMKKIGRANLLIKGRHDACIVPRAVPVIESMMAITLADMALQAGILPKVIR